MLVFTFPLVVAAATAASTSPPEAAGSSHSNPGEAQGIVVRSGTRVRGAVTSLRERVDTYQCGASILVMQIVYDWAVSTTGRRSRLARATIDGRPIPARRLVAINAALTTFERPEIYPVCYETSAALTIREVEWSPARREEHVDLMLHGDR